MTRFALVLFAWTCLAAGTAENVLVVVNTNSALSKSIGEYYARRRSIPAAQICRITAPTDETIERSVYNGVIEPGVARCLTQAKLAERVLYIVTTAGVPLRINGKGGIGGDFAAVDSELTLLYGKLRGAKYGLEGVVPNPLYGQMDAVFRHPDYPIYLVTRLAAYDFPGVKAIIDRAMVAKNTGKFVLDAAASSGEGNEWMKDAAIRLPSSRIVFDESANVLYGVKDVIGYSSWGSNDKNAKRRSPQFRWLPGAIATEYVSTDGRTFVRPPPTWNISTNWSNHAEYYAGSPQSLAADYLDEGATGASGHVYEPYLRFTPHPDKLFPAYYSGRNLAESFYLAIPGLSWQNVVIGDPLCSLGKPRD